MLQSLKENCSTLKKEAVLYCKLVTVGLPVQVPVTAKVVAGEMVLVYIHKPAHRVLVERAVRPALFLLFQDVQNVDHLDLAKKVAEWRS